MHLNAKTASYTWIVLSEEEDTANLYSKEFRLTEG